MSEELRELLLKLKNAIESQNSEDNDIGQILQDIINQVNIDIVSCGENKNCLISLIIKYFMELNNLNFDFIENNEISDFER